MEPRLIKLLPADRQAFLINEYAYQRFPGIWHYHPEFEITFIEKGQGTRFVGDHIESYREGDLVMIGSNLPHTWKSDEAEEEELAQGSKALVLHFMYNCLGAQFWDLTEMADIKKLLDASQLGIRIGAPDSEHVISLMRKMAGQPAPDRLITFLEMLQFISASQKLSTLCSIGFKNSLVHNDSGRITKAYEYVVHNLSSSLSLMEVAKVVNMTPAAFSRYFKTHTRKTFSQFVIELKIGYACKLLMKDNQTVTQVCYECGFNNISNFNKQFRKIAGIPPKKFQLQYVK